MVPEVHFGRLLLTSAIFLITMDVQHNQNNKLPPWKLAITVECSHNGKSPEVWTNH